MAGFTVGSFDFGATRASRLDTGRRLAAFGLRAAGAALGRLALRLEPPLPSRPQQAPQIEFHCEAGAPEGALYLDGRLVARLRGVKRL